MDDERLPELSAEHAALLRDAMTWDAPGDLETAIVDAIEAEASSPGDEGIVVPVKARRDAAVAASTSDQAEGAARRAPVPRWMLAAAAVAVVVAAAAVLARLGDTAPSSADTIVIELAGTERAPGASATAEISATPAGLKILLDTTGLAGAGPGEMYEAWVSDGKIRVSAGTFHLRGGDGPIELWAGVVEPRFTTLAITSEPVDGNTDSSGEVVLRGEYALP